MLVFRGKLSFCVAICDALKIFETNLNSFYRSHPTVHLCHLQIDGCFHRPTSFVFSVHAFKNAFAITMTSNAGCYLKLSGSQNHSTTALPTYTQFHLCLLPSRLDFWWKTSGQPVDMENIRISYFSQGVISNRWCRNSSINSIIQTNGYVLFEKNVPSQIEKNICSSQLGNHFMSPPHVLISGIFRDPQ